MPGTHALAPHPLASQRRGVVQLLTVCALLLGLFAMHALDTHGVLSADSMGAGTPVAVTARSATATVDPGTGTGTGTTSALRLASSTTQHLTVADAPPQAPRDSALRAPAGDPMSTMAMLCVAVLSLALLLVLLRMSARAALRAAGYDRRTGGQPGAPRENPDHRPPAVWEHSVVRC